MDEDDVSPRVVACTSSEASQVDKTQRVVSKIRLQSNAISSRKRHVRSRCSNFKNEREDRYDKF